MLPASSSDSGSGGSDDLHAMMMMATPPGIGSTSAQSWDEAPLSPDKRTLYGTEVRQDDRIGLGLSGSSRLASGSGYGMGMDDDGVERSRPSYVLEDADDDWM